MDGQRRKKRGELFLLPHREGARAQLLLDISESLSQGWDQAESHLMANQTVCWWEHRASLMDLPTEGCVFFTIISEERGKDPKEPSGFLLVAFSTWVFFFHWKLDFHGSPSLANERLMSSKIRWCFSGRPCLGATLAFRSECGGQSSRGTSWGLPKPECMLTQDARSLANFR